MFGVLDYKIRKVKVCSRRNERKAEEMRGTEKCKKKWKKQRNKGKGVTPPLQTSGTKSSKRNTRIALWRHVSFLSHDPSYWPLTEVVDQQQDKPCVQLQATKITVSLNLPGGARTRTHARTHEPPPPPRPIHTQSASEMRWDKMTQTAFLPANWIHIRKLGNLLLGTVNLRHTCCD
jgi:hypothetical protein